MEEKAEIPGGDRKKTNQGGRPEADCEILRQGPRLIRLFEASTGPIFKGLQIPDAYADIVLQPENGVL